jgi:hypothetical protein
VLLLQEPGPFNPLSLVSFTGNAIGGGYLLRESFHPFAELAEMLHGFATTPAGSPWETVATLVNVLPLIGLVAAAAALILRRSDRATRVLAAWFLGALTLYATWSGRDFEFTNMTLVPAGLLSAVAAGRLLSHRPRALAGVAGAVLAAALVAGAINWVGFIRPGLDPNVNPHRQVAEMVAANTQPQDRVVVTGIERQRLKIYVIYFGQRAAVIPEFFFGPDISHEESMRRFEAAMKQACDGGGRLYSLGELVETRDIPSPDGFPFERVRAAVRALGPVEVARIPEGSLYRLERCPR